MENKVRCQYHEITDNFYVFVCGHAIAKGSHDIGYQIAKELGQKELITKIFHKNKITPEIHVSKVE